MGKSKAPKPPDPVKTAAAQTASNIGTALAEGAVNRVNQVTPDGALTYAQSGTTPWRDPLSGRIFDIPSYTATTALSGAQQRIKDQEDAASLNLALLAAGQSSRLQGLLDRPLDLSNEAAESRLVDLGARRLEPRLAEARRRAETEAANRGLRLGSTAYDRLMRGVGENENDAWTQLLLTGRGQAINELLTERNQPLNEISALLRVRRSRSPIWSTRRNRAWPTPTLPVFRPSLKIRKWLLGKQRSRRLATPSVGFSVWPVHLSVTRR